MVLVESGNGQVWGIPSPARIPSLHLPGALKIDPPGSTCQWCFLWLESSAGDAKWGAVLLKRVKVLLGRLQTGQVREGPAEWTSHSRGRGCGTEVVHFESK